MGPRAASAIVLLSRCYPWSPFFVGFSRQNTSLPLPKGIPVCLEGQSHSLLRENTYRSFFFFQQLHVSPNAVTVFLCFPPALSLLQVAGLRSQQ